MKATYTIAAVTALLSLAGLPAAAEAGILYDGSVPLQPLPADQGWSYGTSPLLGASTTQTPLPGGVRLDSTAVRDEKAGYFSKNPIFPGIAHPGIETLDRAAGYTIVFDVKINSESHISNHRAGFSIIAISSDLLGIELGFWADTIFAQEAGFTHTEEAAFTTAAMTRYKLAVAGSTYALSLAGSQTPLLAGPLRDYTPAVVPDPDVYEIPSFLFLGDDTSSASASVDIAYIELAPGPPPLPGDADGDGMVNAADYIALKRHIGQANNATKADGDFDADGDVDWSDLEILQTHFGDTIASETTTIPEPATLFIMMAAGLPAVLKRRRSRG